MRFKVRVQASKAGSIGTKYREKREYVVEVGSRDEVNLAAIKRAHDDGLEHVLVDKIQEAP